MRLLSPLAIVSFLAGVIIAAPAIDSTQHNSTAGALEARYGDRWAFIYASSGCGGTLIASYENFGCGGECHSITGPNGITQGLSVELSQDIGLNPSPTVDVFSDYTCSNKIGHAGIFYGYTDGCTNLPAFGSFYLYYDC